MPEMTAYEATRNAILEALGEAVDMGAISTNSGLHPAESLNDVASMILHRLAGIGTNDPALSILDAATPVITVSVRDVIASAARGALDDLPTTAGEPVDPFAPVAEAPVITVELPAPAGNVRAYRQALFALAPVFGVRLRTTLNDDDTFTLRIGGREADIRAFRSSVFDAVIAANLSVPYEAELEFDEETAFWSTLANLLIDTDEHRALIAAAADRYAAATAALVTRYGAARVISRVTPVTEGRILDLAAEAAAPVTIPAQ